MGTLYKLDFSSGKSYIGVTKAPLMRRIRRHRYDAKCGSDLIMHRAWRRYGDPIVTTLAIVEDRLLLETERLAVAAFETLTPQGYNMTPGGDIQPSAIPAIADKISAKLLGIKRSDETRARMSAARVGYKPSLETREKMRANRIGRKHSLETIKKIKQVSIFCGKNNPMKNPQIAAMVADSKRGKKRPDISGDRAIPRRPGVTKKIVSTRRANGKCWVSDETRKKISLTKKGVKVPNHHMKRPEIAAKCWETRRLNAMRKS
jgi:NUMOD3 motif